MDILFNQDTVLKRHIASEKEQAKQKGIKEGINKGINKGITGMIKNMLSAGTPMDYIVKISGWTEDKIKALQPAESVS